MNNNGAIIIGYQGIGKSSTVKENTKDNRHYVDLESSCWKDNEGKRNDNWYISYCNIALDLAKQGNYVFTSSHEVVRNYFKDKHNNIPIYVVMPSIDLKELWINRLRDRYSITGLDKDKFALLNAQECFVKNVSDLYSYAINSDTNVLGVTLLNTNYNLRKILEEYFKNEENID